MALGALAGLDGLEGMMKPFPIRPLLVATDHLADPRALRQAAGEQGYLYFPGLVADNLVWELRVRVAAICDELGWLAPGAPLMKAVVRSGARIGGYDDPVYLQLARRVLVMPGFKVLGRHPAVIGVMETLFGGPVEPDQGSVCRVFPPGSTEMMMPPHQDHFYVKGATNLWTAWLPLGDCPFQLGGLAVLRSSNRQGPREHTGQGIAKAIVDIPEDAVWDAADLRAGDVVLFNCLTVHQAGANQTLDRLHLSVDYRYRPGGVPSSAR